MSRYPSGSLVKRQKPLQGEYARTPFTGIRVDQTYKKSEVDVKTLKVLTSDGHDWDIVAKLVAEHPHHRPGRGKNLDISLLAPTEALYAIVHQHKYRSGWQASIIPVTRVTQQ